MSMRRLVTLVLPAAIGLFALASPVPAFAATGVTVNGHCSGTSVYSLQVQREDTGKLSVDWGVDMARHLRGVAWKVTEANNGTVFVNKTVTTIADGSFSITRLLAPQPTNHVKASATNRATGETCTASATV
jgi:hypothetical protein